MKVSRKPISRAVTAALISLSMLPAASFAAGASNAELQQLKAQLQALQAKVQQLEDANNKAEAAKAAAPEAVAPAAAAPATDSGFDQRMTYMEMQVDNLSTAAAEGPLAGLSVTGYMDLAYFANSNNKTRSFQFGNGSSSLYSYDNSSQGDIFLDIKKTFGVGATAPSAEIVIAPNRGYGAGATGQNNIIHTAQATIPLSSQTAFIFGQIGSWQGYEVYNSTLPVVADGTTQAVLGMQTITHNLLFDYGIPSFFTGAGFTYNPDSSTAWKFMIANEQNKFVNSQSKSPTFTYRLDYTWSPVVNLGASGYIGSQSHANYPSGLGGATATSDHSLAYYNEFDWTYILGNDTYNAEIDYGHQKDAAWNGKDATWYGASVLGSHKFNASWGATLRYDYLNNEKNGGGTPNLALGSTGTDTLNGFGIDPACLANDPTGTGSDCKGTNRQEITAALLYYATKQLSFKAEVRYDRASNAVFAKANGDLTKNNSLIGLQAIYGF